MEIHDLVRDDIKGLVPYEPHLFNNVIKMDANENPHSFPADVITNIFSGLNGEDFIRYPDPLGLELKGKISQFTGEPPENIVLGNGSDELIQLILQTFGGPGRRVVIPVPTFSMYRIHGEITGTIPLEVPRDDSFGLVTGELLAEMRHPDTRVTFIASPNNPTGNCIPIDEISSLVKGVESLVVVDEAYIDFGGETSLPLLRTYPNLVILRTFSKIGLAGLRVGYLLANRDVTHELSKVKQPYNVNTVSQKAAGAVLDHWPVFREQIAEIAAERDRLAEGMKKMPGVRVYPSQANFILFSTPIPAGEVHRQLLEDRILTRYGLGRTHGLENCLRVTIGTKQENTLFLEKLNEYLVNKETEWLR